MSRIPHAVSEQLTSLHYYMFNTRLCIEYLMYQLLASFPSIEMECIVLKNLLQNPFIKKMPGS